MATNAVIAALRRLATRVLLCAIRAYQLTLSPWLGRQCRFEPTCSVYAAQAIAAHGPLRGSWLAMRRIGRCHPWGGSGYDPVPDAAAAGERYEPE